MEVTWSNAQWQEVIQTTERVARSFRRQVADPQAIVEAALEKIVKAQKLGASSIKSRRAWATKITMRAGIDAVRRERREGIQNGGEFYGRGTVADDVPSTLLRRFESYEVLRTLAGLAHEGYRDAVVLRDLRGLDDREIALELGVTYETARQWVCRGRREIRDTNRSS